MRRLARAITGRDGFHLAGVMTYEGQIAGLPDVVPGQRARSMVIRRLKSASQSQLAVRRRELADALAEIADLEFWNAGGSGSVDTTTDPVVTELAAGSGLLVPGLFDHYRAFAPGPAAFFDLPVVRRPSAGVATVHGGGFVASGAAGRDRLPLPATAAALRIGDRVWFRHAKSGELFEHGPDVHLLTADRIVETVRTYRGCGLSN